jgi:hypothetical protein
MVRGGPIFLTTLACSQWIKSRLGQALVEARIISRQQLQQALQYQADLAGQKRPMRLGEVLVHYHLVQPGQLEAALAAQIESASSGTSDTGVGRIGQYFVQRGLITLAQLHQALAEQAQRRREGQESLLGDVLAQRGYLRQDQLTKGILQWHEEYNACFR